MRISLCPARHRRR